MATSLHTRVPVTIGGAIIAGVALATPNGPGVAAVACAGGAVLVAIGYARAVRFMRPDIHEADASAAIGAACLALAAAAWRHAHPSALAGLCAVGGVALVVSQLAFRVRARRRVPRLSSRHAGAEAAVFNRDGTKLASLASEVSLWDVASGARQLVINPHFFETFTIAFSEDARWLVTGGWDHDPPWPQGVSDTFDIKLWDPATGRLDGRLTGHTGSVVALAFGADGRHLVSTGGDQTVRVWDIQQRQLLATLRGHTTPIHSVACGPEGTAVSACATSIRLWSMEAKEAGRIIEAPSTSMALSRDGSLIAAGDGRGVVTVFDVASGNSLARSPRITGWVSALTFSPDGRFVVGGGPTGTVYVWEARTGRLRQRLWFRHWERIRSLQISRDGRLLASTAADGIVVRPFTQEWERSAAV